MAIKTKMRLGQITGSFNSVGVANGAAHIVTSLAPANMAAVNAASADLSGSLSAIASAIGRIHGKPSSEVFDNAAGEFYHAVKIKHAGGLTVGAGGDEFTITESSDDITLANAIDNKDIIFNLKTAGSAGELARFDANIGGNVKALRLAQALQLGFDGTAHPDRSNATNIVVITFILLIIVYFNSE